MEQAITLDEKGLIRLNIGGTLFLTYTETLACFTGSKLATLDNTTKNYNFNTHEYFFDRNPLLFAYILDACRKGAVHIPKDVCGSTFRQELDFWEISSKHVAPCCWETLYSSDTDVYMMQQLFDNFKQNTNMCLMLEQEKSVRGKIWLFLDEPNASKPAMAWSIFTSLLIIVTTLIEAMMTIPALQVTYTDDEQVVLHKMIELLGYSNSTKETFADKKQNPKLELANVACYFILTIDFVLGFIVCPRKVKFLGCIYRNVILIGYASFWVTFCMQINFSKLTNVNAMVVFIVFKYLTVLKLGRLFFLTKHIPSFTVVGLTFAYSKKELKILAFILGILVCLFGYIMYVAEFFNNGKFTSIFSAMYWASITLTTVGYGDYTPETVFGHVIASVCAVFGVIVLALPIGVIASTFYKFYNYHSYAKTFAQAHGKTVYCHENSLTEQK